MIKVTVYLCGCSNGLALLRTAGVGAGNAQNNRCASKGWYSRTFDLSRCDH